MLKVALAKTSFVSFLSLNAVPENMYTLNSVCVHVLGSKELINISNLLRVKNFSTFQIKFDPSKI